MEAVDWKCMVEEDGIADHSSDGGIGDKALHIDGGYE